MEDLLGKIERGEIKFDYDKDHMRAAILFSTIRNNIYLEHLIEELHPKEKRLAIFKELDEKVETALMDTIALLSARSK
jgi:hypothetical protein